MLNGWRWTLVWTFVLATIGLLIGLATRAPVAADPVGQDQLRGVGTGEVRLQLALDVPQAEANEGLQQVPLGPDQWTTLLSESFENASWPTGTGWQVWDDNGSEGGQYYWANRCSGHHSTRSAWAFGGGANGASLSCTDRYPDLADSWMQYGPVDLSGATEVELDLTFWLDSECEGTNCDDKADKLYALATTDQTNFEGRWWAGNWKDDPSAHPGGWVSRTLDLSQFAGEGRVYILFGFVSDATIGYGGGALVDDVALRANQTCPRTAFIRSFTTDRTCYVPGADIGAFVDVGTSAGSQRVRVLVELWSGDIIWASGERTITAPGATVVPVRVPSDLFPDDYTLVATVYDASDPDCLQDSEERTVRVDPSCGTVTPAVPTTVTPTPTGTASPTPTATPTIEATLCPGESVHETKRIFLPPAPARADVLFAFDTTGSMEPVLSSATTNAVSIMNRLAAIVPDIQFGVLDLRDYPRDPYGEPGDWAYRLRQPITANRAAVEAAIGATTAAGGNDAPEAYSRALYEGYTDSSIGWRSGARQFVVMFGDDVPHDDNLNAGLSSQPVNPGGVWCGDTSAGCVLDPGRDGVPGTSDDLDFQTVLDGVRGHDQTLLYVVSGGGSTSQSNLVTYWRQWAKRTSSGGDAVPLTDAANLPGVIESLITSASRRISRLELRAVPPGYQSWLTIQPPAYTNLEIPPAGMTVSFEVEIRVPRGTALGTTHRFAIQAIGDGAVYGGQGVTIHVPTTCVTVTPTATPPTPPTPTPTTTPVVCPTPRPSVGLSCAGPNYVRNPSYEKASRSWGQHSTLGRPLVSSTGALEGFYSAGFYGPAGQPSDERLFQYMDVPPDVTAASFSVTDVRRALAAFGSPIAGTGNFFRASIYDATMTTELVRMWSFDPLLPLECPIDPPSYNLTPVELDRIRGRTVVLVLRLHKVTPGWQTTVQLDRITFNVCSAGPPCRVEGNKTAAPDVVLPGGETTVTLSLTGLDGACLPHRRPADVMLVLDRSGSMQGQKMADAKTAAKGFLDQMDPAVDQVGLVSFANNASLDLQLSAWAGPVRTAIDGMIANGDTNITQAIQLAAAELASVRHRTGNTPVIILLSDGNPNVGGDPRAAASAAKAAGVRLFTIGLGTDIDPSLMRDLATSPDDYFFAPDSAALAGIYEAISGLISGSPATNITIVDRLSPYVTLVPNSFTGVPAPEVSSDGRTLTWRIPRLGLETRIWTYRVRMTETPGTWPVNDSAVATYTNSIGEPGQVIFPNPEVTVLPPAAEHPQLICRDHATDDGTTPSNAAGQAWWDSPDIWVRNEQDGVPLHQNPQAGQANYVYVRVHNIGDATVDNITVHVYDAQGATSIRWPDDWTPEIGRADIARLGPGRTAVVSIPWVPAYEGHYCFLTRITAPDDPITFDGWVPFDNNICQRNVQIIGGDGAPSGTSSVGVGNRERGTGYVGLRLRSPDFPTGGAATVKFTDPELFDRWRKAGGGVSGGTIMTDTHSVVADVDQAGRVDLTLDRVPFEGEETSKIELDLRGPGGRPLGLDSLGQADAALPVITIEQYDSYGRPLGGNVIRPPARLELFMPLLLKDGQLGGS